MPLKTSMHFKSATMRWPRKQKPRALLSSSMISQPLGDFRHLSHIGLNESFGDVSVFQRTGSLVVRGSHSDQNLYLTGPPPPKPPRLLTPEEAAAQARSSTRPTHKKSHSLPLLDDVEVELPCRDKVGGEVDGPAGLNSKLSPKAQWSVPSPLPADDLLLSLNLDLGPSILEDVLRVMDSQ
ncbi:cdc42 effector protein 2-like [Clupea harengus]|uniref:Cdc42 effector protein 2-like n=1 Tax=Clupea harengus TaxID=7950 RepID=A0A6P3VV83_CLUHA|nr:cdc42 effector protein 2-like [Clupea harengus]